MWPDGHALNRFIVAQSPRKIAEIAGLALPDTVKFFMVEEDGIGADFLFTGEKLSVVTTLYRYGDFEEALAKAEKIMAYQGLGHSCGIHTSHDDRVLQLAERIKVSRIMVNQPQCLANSGAWTNGIPMSLTLGCGTWGKNSVSHNVTWKDLINTTWVSWPIPSTQPTDEDLFPASVREFNKG
jgi:sulfoacetaldehyde dehydrogenase